MVLIEKTAKVGIFIDSIGTFGRGVTRGVLAYQRYRQWQLSMLRTWIFQPAAFIDHWSGDGLIAMIPDDDIAQSLAATGKPFVCVSSLLPELYPVSVVADDFAVGQMAAHHFLDRGFRNFGFCGQSDSDPPSSFVVNRRGGFVHEIEQAGFTVQSIAKVDDLEHLLKNIMLPAAIFASNDELGIRVISMAERLGLRVPEQIAVLGVDNDDLLVESGSISLSSIQLPTFKIGFEAASLLDQIIRGIAPAQTLLKMPPVEVVTRKSTDITAIADPDLTAALAFIRQHVAEPIGVPDVVSAVPVSRRVLERRFQKHLQRSLFEEIQRVHIERACSLLIDTELSIADVAQASGFSCRSRFHAAFARATGRTPKDYRMQYHNSISTPEDTGRRRPSRMLVR